MLRLSVFMILFIFGCGEKGEQGPAGPAFEPRRRGNQANHAVGGWCVVESGLYWKNFSPGHWVFIVVGSVVYFLCVSHRPGVPSPEKAVCKCFAVHCCCAR